MSAAKVPVWAKMTPNVTPRRIRMRAALRTGSRNHSAINTIRSVIGVTSETCGRNQAFRSYTTPGGYSFTADHGRSRCGCAWKSPSLTTRFPGRSLSGSAVESCTTPAQFTCCVFDTVQVLHLCDENGVSLACAPCSTRLRGVHGAHIFQRRGSPWAPLQYFRPQYPRAAAVGGSQVGQALPSRPAGQRLIATKEWRWRATSWRQSGRAGAWYFALRARASASRHYPSVVRWGADESALAHLHLTAYRGPLPSVPDRPTLNRPL